MVCRQSQIRDCRDSVDNKVSTTALAYRQKVTHMSPPCKLHRWAQKPTTLNYSKIQWRIWNSTLCTLTLLTIWHLSIGYVYPNTEWQVTSIVDAVIFFPLFYSYFLFSHIHPNCLSCIMHNRAYPVCECLMAEGNTHSYASLWQSSTCQGPADL